MKWPSALTLAGLLKRGVNIAIPLRGRPQHGKANKQPPTPMPFEKHKPQSKE